MSQCCKPAHSLIVTDKNIYVYELQTICDGYIVSNVTVKIVSFYLKKTYNICSSEQLMHHETENKKQEENTSNMTMIKYQLTAV